MHENGIPEDFKNIIVLEFTNVSQSSSYTRVIQLAQNLSKYNKIGIGKNEKHFVGLVESEKDQWFELYNLVLNWKTSRIHYKNESTSPRNYLGIITCYLNQTDLFKIDNYCFLNNWIGCQRIYEGHELDSFKGAGSFLSDNEFEPNKETIKRNITNTQYRINLCPLFDWERIEKSLRDLPTIINLGNNENWKPILEPDSSGKIIHIIGIHYQDKQILKNVPIITEVENLNTVTFNDHGILKIFDEVWEYRIIILSREKYKIGRAHV